MHNKKSGLAKPVKSTLVATKSVGFNVITNLLAENVIATAVPGQNIRQEDIYDPIVGLSENLLIVLSPSVQVNLGVSPVYSLCFN